VLCVCEWSYLEWANAKTVTTDDELYLEWIDLHRGEYFTSVVKYLRSLLDQEGELASDAEREAINKRFLQTVQLEEDFFDNAYA
jgi:thiaminase/transcriptional activator TenA